MSGQAAEKGLLWKAEAPGGKVSYLFGTMHSDDPRVNDFSPALLKALSDSDAFMMETLPPSDPTVYFMKDHVISDLLTETEMQQLMKLADFHAMHTDVAMHMKPWLLAMVFDLPKPQSPFTQDVQLFAKAQEQSKQILGIEDTAEHFGMLDSFSQEDQLTMLRAVLKRSQEEKEKDFESLLNAYLTEDSAKIAGLDDKITGGMLTKDLWARMRVKLIDERNVRMAERIAQQANESPVFIAIGASHLAGKGGLVERLRDAGFKLTVIQ
jgi:hypothetical protein